jgi:hypothetical protein
MRYVLIAAASLSASAWAQAPNAQVADLGWLSGSWLSETRQGWTEEMWMAPRGGVMLGVNRSGKSERASGFEYMRIAADTSERVSFWASPAGKPPVPFRLVSSGPREAVFENVKNDYPTRIVYRRTDATLAATISGPEGSKPMSWTFRRR